MAGLMLVNPKKRRKSTTKKRRSTGMTRSKKRVTRRRRNPIASGGMMGQLQNAAIGAGGALAVDVVMSKLPLPANLTSGPMLPAVKGAVAIGLGMLVSKFGKKRALGKTIAEGGLTVALHDVAKPMLQRVIPNLGEYDDSDLMGYDLMGDEFDDIDAMDMNGYDNDLSSASDFENEFEDMDD